MSDKIEYAVSTISDAYGISSDALQSAILYAVGYGDDDRLVQLGAVQPFDTVPTAHDEVRKLVEEAAEVFSAFETYEAASIHDPFEGAEREAYNDLTDEIADVIQVVANLLCSLGIHDARQIIRACRGRNIARGRIRKSQR